MDATTQRIETHETYSNGYVRPVAMAKLPDWALNEMLNRHHGPALEAAQGRGPASRLEPRRLLR